MSILGTALPAASTLATLYEVPTGRRAVVNVGICNRGTAAAKVRMAVSMSAEPADAEYIEYDTWLGASEVLERTAVSIAAGQKIIVQADVATVAFNAWGLEEIA